MVGFVLGKLLIVTRQEHVKERLLSCFNPEDVEISSDFRKMAYLDFADRYSKVFLDVSMFEVPMIDAFSKYLHTIEGIEFSFLPECIINSIDFMSDADISKFILYTSDSSTILNRFNSELGLAYRTDLDVVLIGSVGVGKSYWAQKIFDESTTHKNRFRVVHCGSHKNIFEAELFGYVRGAFTDAKKDTPGALEDAEGGIVFLDDMECLDDNGQALLLDVLSRRKYRPLGSLLEKDCDVRFLFAVKDDIIYKVQSGLFRRDLWSRMSCLNVSIPPLNYRKGEIPMLIQDILDKYGKVMTDAACHSLMVHNWNANVRALRKIIELACLRCADDEVEIKKEYVDLNYDL